MKYYYLMLAAIWICFSGLMGCSNEKSTYVDSTARIDLRISSVPIEDVSDSVLEAQGANDLKGKLVFLALSESIGVEIAGGKFKPLIEAGTMVPVELLQKVGTAEDGQEELSIKFFRGTSEFTDDNYLLGEVTVLGLSPGKANSQQIELKLSITKSGDFHISAREFDTSKHYKVRLYGNESRS